MKKISLLFIGLFFCSFAKAGLIGHWGANGNALDSTGNNNGILIGNTTYVAGNEGQAFSFDGNMDSVFISQTLDVSTEFSMSAWINPLTTSDIENQIFNNESSYEMAIRSGTFQYAIETDAVGAWFWVDTGISVTANQWSFFGLTYDGTVTNVYNDIGLLFSSNSISGNVIDLVNNQVHIGSRFNNTQSFHGAIDDVYIFDHALTSSEILDVSNNSYDVPEPISLALLALGLAGFGCLRKKKGNYSA